MQDGYVEANTKRNTDDVHVQDRLVDGRRGRHGFLLVGERVGMVALRVVSGDCEELPCAFHLPFSHIWLFLVVHSLSHSECGMRMSQTRTKGGIPYTEGAGDSLLPKVSV